MMISTASVERLIRTSEPRQRWWRGSTLALLGCSMLLGAFWAEPGLIGSTAWVGWLVPHALIATILVLIARDVFQQRRLGQLLQDAQEAVQWRDWDRAGRALTQLLSRPIRMPSTRIRGLLALAAVAEGQREYDAVLRICGYLRQEAADQPFLRHLAEVSLAAALLRTGQTTDAVTMIDRLTAMDLPAGLKAQVELLALLREVMLGHAHEVLDLAPRRQALFRAHLGTQAGYGYGLLAAAHERAGRSAEAAQLWRQATLLIRREELLARVPELGPVAARYPAVEHPL